MNRFYLITCLLFTACLFQAAPAFAQAGSQIIEQVRSGDLSIGDAAQNVASQTGLQVNQATDLVRNLSNATKIDTAEAGGLLDRVTGGTFNDATQALQTAQSIGNMARNIQSALSDPEAIRNLAQQVAMDNLPPQIGEALGAINQLGNIQDIGDIQAILENPLVKNGLENLMNGAGLPQDVTDAVSKIAQIAADPTAILDAGLENVRDQLTQALQNAAPEVFNDLAAAVGGVEALQNLMGSQINMNFNAITGGALGSLLGGALGGGSAGKYEIFPRDPKASPVSKTCTANCSACTCKRPIESNHIRIRAHVTDEFIKHRNWMIDEFFTKHVLYALGLMTQQFTTMSMRQTYIIGKFFDAKHQLESQLLFQRLMAEAHKDYQPSEGICEIGTAARSLAPSRRESDLAQVVLANRMMDRILLKGEGEATLAGGSQGDMYNRVSRFVETYCNVNDNSQGLTWLCGESAGDGERVNRDINFVRAILSQQTLESDLMSGDNSDTKDIEDVMALSANLFAPEVYPGLDKLMIATPQGLAREEALKYQDLRSLIAKRSVAQNAFSAIAAERVDGLETIDYSHMKFLVKDLGMTNDEVQELVGDKPSYYAQREVLSNYALENPVFYTELYESPANVYRKDAALKAVNLMMEDDFFDRQLESEATLAVILEVMLEEEHQRTSRELVNIQSERN
jgi:hypothetical protein